jgi:hypothetical protein
VETFGCAFPPRRRRRVSPPLRWGLLAHRFGFWVHFIHQRLQRFKLAKLRRRLLMPWQRPAVPHQLPPIRGTAPVIPLLSQALDPPPIPPPGPSRGPNRRWGAQRRRTWSLDVTLPAQWADDQLPLKGFWWLWRLWDQRPLRSRTLPPGIAHRPGPWKHHRITAHPGP